jgi:hypothetical protein
MEDFLLFFEEQQTWIYLALAIIGAVYLRFLFVAYRTSRRAFYALERERSSSRMRRSIAMLLLVFAGMTTTFLIVNFASPSIPIALRPTSLPTVSLLATPVGSGGQVDEEPSDGAAAIPSAPDDSGCLNENATILQPQNGETVSGTIVILGVANIPNFAFYKVEYRRLDGEWVTITAGSQAVCETCGGSEEEGTSPPQEDLQLGSWDTRLVEPGTYGFRLVVLDTEGNAPLPCEIQIQILPAE